MISGRVNDIYEAVISVEVVAYDRRTAHRFDAVIDTGFSQYLMMPRGAISQMGLPIEGSRPLVLGNQQRHDFEFCYAAVFWDDEVRAIPVLISESETLVGARLLAGYLLTAAMVPGGRVTITKLP